MATDATPGGRDWNHLQLLVNRAMEKVEAELMQAKGTLLLSYPGLLARYDHLELLVNLRQMIARGEGPKGCWLLVPDDKPLIDGKAISLGSPSQAIPVPKSWVRNLHRRGQQGEEGMGSIA